MRRHHGKIEPEEGLAIYEAMGRSLELLTVLLELHEGANGLQ